VPWFTHFDLDNYFIFVKGTKLSSKEFAAERRLHETGKREIDDDLLNKFWTCFC